MHTVMRFIPGLLDTNQVLSEVLYLYNISASLQILKGEHDDRLN